jgi:uncharacterized protein (TIGR02646 family)
MISVKKHLLTPPPILISQRCNKKKARALVEKDKHEVCRICCGKQVRSALSRLYHGKCAYCETKAAEAGWRLRIEHYRPRRKIKGENSHKGYYWLVYEWSNLIPACEMCNEAKSNAFPIKSRKNRSMGPVFVKGKLSSSVCFAGSRTLRSEKPLILHPEIDKPEEHLIFLPNGRVKGITEHGKQTIDVCDLNSDLLILARRKVINKFLNKLKKMLNRLIEEWKSNKNKFVLKFDDFDEFFIELLNAHDPRKSYSRLGWFMFKKYELFFFKQLGKRQQSIAQKAFESFKKRYYAEFS